MGPPDERSSWLTLSRLRFLIAVSAVLLLTFLFFKSRPVDLARHEAVQDKLRRLNQVDSQLNQDLLKLGYSLLTHYDSIVSGIGELREIRRQLEDVPDYLDEDGAAEFRMALADYGEVLEQKDVLIQQLKWANVRLKTSLSYLPVLSAEIAQMAPPTRDSQSTILRIKDLLRDVLLYNLTFDNALTEKVDGHIAALQRNFRLPENAPEAAQANLILRHVKEVMTYKPQLVSLTRDLVQLPTNELVRKAQEVYSRHYERVTMRADSYRAYLYIFSIALLVYIGYIIFELRQITHQLNTANENLEERVQERTRELDRSESRNRALLNAIPDLMMRLDRDGNFLDAKDSNDLPLGVSPESLAGRHLSQVFPPIAEIALPKIAAALETGDSQTMTFETVQDGRPQDLEARIVVSGQNQVLMIVRDVTEQSRAAEKVANAQRRSEELLHNILPEEVATELKIKGTVAPKYFEDVSILFTNFVGFSASTEELAAEELVDLLHDYFSAFDEITCRYRLEKLKTVGDIYVCVGGLPKRKPSHPVDVVLAAMEMVRAVEERDRLDKDVRWSVRVGIHTGPVVAGVVGIQKFAFDVFGPSVNFSSRLKSSGAPNRINVSADTYSRIKDFFSCRHRGKVATRDREVDMYFVESILPSLLDGPESPPPAFRNRYRIYFQSDPPSFPANVNSTGDLQLGPPADSQNGVLGSRGIGF